MKSVMTAGQLQSQVPKADINRSSFNRSHGLKTTFDVDKLVPILVDEVLPGDTHKLNTNIFARLATPINPIMDNMYLDTFYFFVPMRLVWDNYAKFFGEQTNPGDSTDYVIPKITSLSSGATTPGSLTDYFGVPINRSYNAGTQQVNALPYRAYWLIYDEWFRDQNLQDSANIYRTDNGGQITAQAGFEWWQPATRGKRHDYFTSCLPFAQKGDSITLPVGDKAYIGYEGEAGTQATAFFTNPAGAQQQGYLLKDTSTNNIEIAGLNNVESRKLYADLSQATSASINDWRQAFQIQRFLEKDARSGTRYTEKVKGFFGVTSPDSRLQRPEYLGGGTTPVNIHPVAQQSATDSTSPQGNLSAFGTASENNSGFIKSFTEHGYIIGLANVRADLTYQQGLDRMWSRETQYDFFWPTFAHLGEQAVLNKEIFVSGTATDDEVFGYQERYAEYKYKRSQLTGLFRSDASASLDAWHLSEDFANTPTLGDTFIKSNTPLDRAIAVPSEPHFIMDAFFNLTSIRPMPVFSPPGMIDHF
jgi:hypothetical protein